MIFDFLKKLRSSNKKPQLPKSWNINGLDKSRYQLIFIDSPNSIPISQELIANLDKVISVCEKNGCEFVSYSNHFKRQFNEVDLNSLFYKYPFLKPYPIIQDDEISEELYCRALLEKFDLQENQLPVILLVSNTLQEIFELSGSIPLGDQLNKIFSEVHSILNTRYSVVRNSIAPQETPTNMMEAEVDASFVENLPLITDKIYTEIDRLVSSGNKKVMEEVYLFLVKKKYNPEIKTLSRIRIDFEFKLWLLDYGNIEIVLTPLQKTVYLFFLNHPSGVYLHDLVDFKDELLRLYKQISKNADETDLEERINDLVNIGSNSINEKCSRIKEAFIRAIAPDLAKHYYITGERGQKKGINLEQEFVLNESPYQHP